MALYNPAHKRVSAGALFFNEKGEMLVVKPTYKEGWLIPGGSVEENESPREACEREIKEELGLTISITTLLAIDAVGGDSDPLTGIAFTFYGGILTKEQITSIILPKDELSEFRFVAQKNLSDVFPKRKISRYNFCFEALKEKTIYYLERGKLPAE